ncbi:phage scaffolding protein [Suipraeoptans intestinalis]|uniref:phage scaffolding protein n=1 Tax=Suipraeoptans intestinalis TaxID=2606628 RepID=UPI002A75BF57|nr:phage scaffolding protein [Suipraeoptans intestinalis]MDY3121739.1 phage scaffolding protein [Suipraeoptans intestinalis]
MDTVSEKLKAFDGVDVEALNGEIKKLQGTIEEKEAEYAAKEADRAFSDTLKEAIKTAGGRNDKAIIDNSTGCDNPKNASPYQLLPLL